MKVVNLGIKLDGYGANQKNRNEEITVIGYLARICPEKGLHLLVEACQQVRLKHSNRRIKLRVAGYLSKRDEKYFADLLKRIESLGMGDIFDYVGEVDHAGKIEFLNSLDIFSVPTVYHESKGLSILEALASAVPVVQPDHGLFPEIIERTGGGILVEPESVDALVAGIESLIADPVLRQKLGRQGHAVVHDQFSDRRMAEATLAVYQQYFD